MFSEALADSADRIEELMSATNVSASASADPSHLPLTRITPFRGLFDWRLGQLWRYRDLVTLFIWRDFVSVYKQTVLGPAWHLVKPLISTLIFTVVFSRMAGLSTDGAPPFLFYLVGSVGWAYFSTSLEGVSRTFMANAGLLGKVYFHRMVIPISIVFSNLIAFGIQFAILVAAMAFYALSGTTLHITVWALFLPLFILMLAGFALGGGLLVCAATTRYRDLNHLVTFGVQLLMYLTPVIYPLSQIPESYRRYSLLNPLTPLFEAIRRGLLGVGTVDILQLVWSGAVMTAMVVAGLMLFTRAERTFLDTI